MRVPIFQLDAFAHRRFTGNPAAVMALPAYPDDDALQAMAAENNLAETAFLKAEGDDYAIRWFTPTMEVPLCGHATLASAAVVMEYLETGRTDVVFHSISGPLPVRRTNDGYAMDFPARPCGEVALPDGMAEALGIIPQAVFAHPLNYLCLLKSVAEVERLTPDMAAIARLDRSGVIVTARGAGVHDFVSRYFAPAKGIPEDPVTGGAHCMLAPFWAKRLGKTEFRAWQASKRGGEILCRLRADRVELEGRVVFYMRGEAEI
jgi:PhzF family phenazine biosynthesis protein